MKSCEYRNKTFVKCNSKIVYPIPSLKPLTYLIWTEVCFDNLYFIYSIDRNLLGLS